MKILLGYHLREEVARNIHKCEIRISLAIFRQDKQE